MGLQRQTLYHKTPLFPGKAAPYWVYECWRGKVLTLLLEIRWTLVLSCYGALEDWHKLFNNRQRREKMFQGYLISNCFDTTFCPLFYTFLEISGKIPSTNHGKLYSVLNHQNSGGFLTAGLGPVRLTIIDPLSLTRLSAQILKSRVHILQTYTWICQLIICTVFLCCPGKKRWESK